MIGKHYPAYSEYKDSGVEWLGKIPKHWETKKAKHVSSIFVPQRNKPELNLDSGLPWITMDDITSPSVDSSITGYYVNELDALTAGSKVLPPGCVIASCVGNFGVASVNKVSVIINQQLQAYIPKKIDSWFLRYLVEVSKLYFEKVATATTLVYVNQERFGELPIVLPALEEQQAICNYINQETAEIDEIIEQQQQLISLLEEERATVISHAVTKGIERSN
ncbi:restriction endonuclease subunit S [Phormidium sp. LEGE 05292]|uniref:restriction endonuclease subunit S n=1 Tax=[Phormidium] sp. LEGE 05292 TaxID=767427 RepID=UPI0018800E5E|nr:restriction endonuclease subunit S [Phormidium sp. LEGE 05292]MBE9226258.1 restriction endonuclease subunit S [Phormidium sp. LEGE 05292]